MHLAAWWELVAASAVAGIIFGTVAETTLSKGLPDGALVGTVGKSTVGIEDGITGLDEVGVAWLAIGIY